MLDPHDQLRLRDHALGGSRTPHTRRPPLGTDPTRG
jgi:hypothetical protein